MLRASLMAQLVKNSPAIPETWARSLGWEDPLEKGKATHSSILAWRIPWTVESMRSQRVGHDWMTFTSLHFISHAQGNAQNPSASVQQYMNWKLPNVQAGTRKGRGTRDQISKTHWVIQKAREFQKNIYVFFIDYANDYAVWITIKCGKLWNRWEYQTTLPASWETCVQVKKLQLALDMEQQTGSKLRKV